MPETEHDTATFLKSAVTGTSFRPICFIEKVHSMPKQGVRSMFTFGQNYGFLRGLIVALRVPFEDVPPGTWQRSMHCLTKGDKNVSKGRAQALFPNERITHYVADALLIAEYGRRKFILVSEL